MYSLFLLIMVVFCFYAAGMDALIPGLETLHTDPVLAGKFLYFFLRTARIAAVCTFLLVKLCAGWTMAILLIKNLQDQSTGIIIDIIDQIGMLSMYNFVFSGSLNHHLKALISCAREQAGSR